MTAPIQFFCLGDNISHSQKYERGHVKYTNTLTGYEGGKLVRLDHRVEWEMSDDYWIANGVKVGMEGEGKCS